MTTVLNSYRNIDGIHVWGDADDNTLAQMRNVSYVGNVQSTALMADNHLGYSQPIGGVVAYRDTVSPSGVGYDIGCGVKAVRTNLTYADISNDMPKLVDEIAKTVSFGMGRSNPNPVDHELFDSPMWTDVKWITHLKDLAARQLGTVGSGNHYVDLLVERVDETYDAEIYGERRIWVACHFGSRGFGHKTASGFINLAKFNGWGEAVKGESMHDNPTLIEKKNNEFLFDAYVAAMELAGQYAYAGRDYVIGQVLGILRAKSDFEVHNHHNFAWLEEHGGEKVWVVRKGATPAFAGQLGFVGGSMGDIAAVVEGISSDLSDLALNSTVHGAGRVMSRSQAKGNRKGTKKGLITRQMMSEATRGVVVRGGDVDESPHVYRPLVDVLDAHERTISIRHTLKPVGVVMAGADVYDPFKD
jgi:tRNA-splicing ligase RtcB